MAAVALVNNIPKIKMVIISFTFDETYKTKSMTLKAPIQATIAKGQAPVEVKIPMETIDENPKTNKATPRLAPALIPST